MKRTEFQMKLNEYEIKYLKSPYFGDYKIFDQDKDWETVIGDTRWYETKHLLSNGHTVLYKLNDDEYIGILCWCPGLDCVTTNIGVMEILELDE